MMKMLLPINCLILETCIEVFDYLKECCFTIQVNYSKTDIKSLKSNPNLDIVDLFITDDYESLKLVSNELPTILIEPSKASVKLNFIRIYNGKMCSIAYCDLPAFFETIATQKTLPIFSMYQHVYLTYMKLSIREKEIFKLLSEYKTSSRIAKNLSISVKTVENHKTNIKNKFGVSTVNEIVSFAFFLVQMGKTSFV